MTRIDASAAIGYPPAAADVLVFTSFCGWSEIAPSEQAAAAAGEKGSAWRRPAFSSCSPTTTASARRPRAASWNCAARRRHRDGADGQFAPCRRCGARLAAGWVGPGNGLASLSDDDAPVAGAGPRAQPGRPRTAACGRWESSWPGCRPAASAPTTFNANLPLSTTASSKWSAGRRRWSTPTSTPRCSRRSAACCAVARTIARPRPYVRRLGSRRRCWRGSRGRGSSEPCCRGWAAARPAPGAVRRFPGADWLVGVTDPKWVQDPGFLHPLAGTYPGPRRGAGLPPRPAWTPRWSAATGDGLQQRREDEHRLLADPSFDEACRQAGFRPRGPLGVGRTPPPGAPAPPDAQGKSRAG